jgi:hypothetical protein
MVFYENSRVIHLRLQESETNEKLFRAINVFLFGGIMQLPLVEGHCCFIQLQWFAAEVNLWHRISFCEVSIDIRRIQILSTY